MRRFTIRFFYGWGSKKRSVSSWIQSRCVRILKLNFMTRKKFTFLWCSFICLQRTLKSDVLKVLQTKFKKWLHFVTISVYKSCADVYKFGKQISGVYKIDPDGLGEFEVFCDHKTAGGGWTVFQKRRDGSVDFFRAWDAYKRGFGNLNGEFWLSLDKIHRLTASSSNKLRVDLEDLRGSTAFAEYSSFAVTSERAKYQLSLGSYSGKLKRDSD